MKNSYIREHLAQYGAIGLTETQLVEVVAGAKAAAKLPVIMASSDVVKPDAEDTLSIIDASYDELRYKGFTSDEAVRLVATIGLAKKIAQRAASKGKDRVQVKDPESLAAYLKPILADLTYEVFYVVALNTKNRIIAAKAVSQGSLTGAVVHPREIFNFCILHHAAAAALAHNHPSLENPAMPSWEDDRVTKMLVESGKILGIPVVDHVIISGNSFFSYAAEGRL